MYSPEMCFSISSNGSIPLFWELYTKLAKTIDLLLHIYYNIDTMQAVIQQFSQYLESNSLRLTNERRNILEQAFAYDGHFRADDLLIYMRQNGYNTSHGTIYRTLPLLVKSGLLTEVIDAQNQSLYEHIHSHLQHAHLICLRCNAIIEFENTEIAAIQESICETHEFKPVKHRNEILGYCVECQ